MSNTTTINGNTITITGLDADWSWDSDTPQYVAGLFIDSIRFHPSGPNDVFIVHEGGINGAELFSAVCSDNTDDRIQYYHGLVQHPVIDISDCTLTTAASAKLTIQLA